MRDSGLKGYRKGGFRTKGIRNRREAGHEGYKQGVMQDRWDTGREHAERRNAERRDAGKQGCTNRGMKERRDAGKKEDIQEMRDANLVLK